jgi:hypothetical protein
MTSFRRSLPRALPLFAAHFPGMPILPGGVLVEWARELDASLAGGGAGPERWSATFKGRITPDADVELTCSGGADGAAAIEVAQAGEVRARLVKLPTAPLAAPTELGPCTAWRPVPQSARTPLTLLDDVATGTAGASWGHTRWSAERLAILAGLTGGARFGETFALIEMLGQCALLGLPTPAEACRPFGLAQLPELWLSGEALRDGAVLDCQTRLRPLHGALVTWSGTVRQDGVPVAATRGISVALSRP